MKNIGVILVLLIFSAAAWAQSSPKTVTDFYLALPSGIYGIDGLPELSDSYFGDDFYFYANARNQSEEAIRQDRKSYIKTEDIKNGYLKLEAEAWDGSAEIALFKKTDETYLVAITQSRYLGPGTAGAVIFVSYHKGKWTDVTKSVFSGRPFSDIGYFKLPRVGTTVELVCGDERGDESKPDCQTGKTLAEYKWDKTRFVKQAK
jgi:hypothetical protein